MDYTRCRDLNHLRIVTFVAPAAGNVPLFPLPLESVHVRPEAERPCGSSCRVQPVFLMLKTAIYAISPPVAEAEVPPPESLKYTRKDVAAFAVFPENVK